MKKLSALIICLLALLLFTACNGSSSVDEGGKGDKNCQDGHKFELADGGKEATCTEDGTLVYVCSVCEERKTETVKALGHNEVTEDAVAATCTEDGKTEKKYCADCGTVTLESQTIPAGHVIDKQIENIGYMSNENRNGAAFFSCLNCNEQVKFELPPLGDPAYTVETVGDNLKYTCQVEGHTAVLYVSLFSFAEKDGMSYYVLTGYAGNSASPTLPTTYNDKPVKEIGESAFAGNTKLTSLTIPSGYTVIGTSAFKDCSALKSVTIPEGIYSIENASFANCTALLSVTLPASVEKIEPYAFSGCTKLTEVKSVAGSRMNEIYSYAFSNCTSLKSFNLGGNMTGLGVLYGCTALEELTVKSVSVGGVSGLGRLFAEASSSYTDNSIVPATLKTVTITGYVTITDLAFYECKKIEKIVIENCEAIGRDTDYYPCFKGCDALKELYIVRADEINAISSCPSLQVITIDYVGTIRSHAFSGITPPTTISIKGVGTARAGAFSGCTAITQESIGSIGQIEGEPYSNLTGTYAYADTEISVTDQFWYLLVQVKEAGMLEYIFGDLPHAEELIDVIERSNSKEEYEVNAAQFSRMTGENVTVTFAPGAEGQPGTMTITGGTYPGQYSYIESSGYIYLVANNKYYLFFTIDAENDSIFEYHTTEDGTWVKHIYYLQ